MKLLYIAGKYRGETEAEVAENVGLANMMAIAVIRYLPGWYPITPHKNTKGFGGLRSDKYFLEGSKEIVKRCDAVLLLDNWKDSQGARMEKRVAELNGIKVYHSIKEMLEDEA